MTINHLMQVPIVPVLRKIPYPKSAHIIGALHAGGIRAVEITMETDRAEDIIKETINCYGEEMLVGAGTVLTIEDCRRAIDAGAQFIVSPALDEEVTRYAYERQVLVIPGVFTPSEIVRAQKLGAQMVKLFPASVVGPGFIKDVKGPLGSVKIMCTGGITKDTAVAYMDAGASAIGAGSALLKTEYIETNNWTGLTDEVKVWLKNVWYSGKTQGVRQ